MVDPVTDDSTIFVRDRRLPGPERAPEHADDDSDGHHQPEDQVDPDDGARVDGFLQEEEVGDDDGIPEDRDGKLCIVWHLSGILHSKTEYGEDLW